jgi:hypothetical protein
VKSTPQIPAWLYRYRHTAYTNIYEWLPGEPRVFGTESLFGDWDAEVLLLAKDYAPASIIRKRIESGDSRPYRAAERAIDGGRAMGVSTNENLRLLVRPIADIPMLYGSAFGGLMRNDDQTSGALPAYREILTRYAVPLLKWCIEELPRLRAIVCLGQEATETLENCFGLPLPFRSHGRATPFRLAGRELLAFPMYHTSRAAAHPGGWSAREREWQLVADRLKRNVESPLRPDGRIEPVFHRVRTPQPEDRAPVAKKRSGSTQTRVFPEELRDWLPSERSPRATAQVPWDSASRAGKHVFLGTLSRPGGATTTELWQALRRHGVEGWDTASKFKGGFGVVREMGWGLWVDRASGRIYAYRQTADLRRIKSRARDRT